MSRPLWPTVNKVHSYLTACPSHRYGRVCVDPQLKVFDLRVLRPLPPMPATMLHPLLVKALPSWGNTGEHKPFSFHQLHERLNCSLQSCYSHSWESSNS